MTPQMAAGAQVRALGHDPEQIPLVVMTHLHFDHLGGSDQFPGAEFLVAKTEWSDPPSSTKGTYGHHRDAVRRWRLLDDTASAGEPHDGLSRTWDLFGDGSVLLAWTPGHTPGHLSVVLRLRGGRPALLTADAAYARRTIDERLVPMPLPRRADLPALARRAARVRRADPRRARPRRARRRALGDRQRRDRERLTSRRAQPRSRG
jgi:glyoxylase-like metal-dependent hydrolase (beta-lactamase superfamily II)